MSSILFQVFYYGLIFITYIYFWLFILDILDNYSIIKRSWIGFSCEELVYMKHFYNISNQIESL